MCSSDLSYSPYPDPPDQAVLSDFVRLRQVRQGQDLTVIALGVTIEEAQKAVDSLRAKHPSSTIDLYSSQSLVPFDYKTMLRSIHKTGRLLLIEDGVESGGFGTLLGAQVARTHPGVLIDYAGVSQPDRGQATRSELIKEEGLDKEGLEGRMSKLLGLPGSGG